MAAKATASLIVRLRDLVSGPAKGIRAAVGKIGQDFSKLRGGFDLAGHVGMAAGAVNQLGSQARGVLELIVNPALQFEDTMARVGALTRGATKKDIQGLSDMARQLGRDTRFMAQDSARGFEQLAIAGFDAKQQMMALPSILKLSQASGSDLGRVADISSDLMGAFGKKAQDVGRINGVLAATFSNSTTTLETLFETFKMSAPIATKAGVAMEQTAILAGLLGNAGMKGSMGGTTLRGVLLALAAPTKKANTSLRQLGLSSVEISNNLKNPAILIKKIADGFAKGKFGEAKKLKILNDIFGRRQAAGAAVLIDAVNQIQDNGKTAFENLSEGVYEAEGSLNRIANVMDNTGLAAVYKFKSAMESLKLDLAKELTPVLGPLTKELTSTVNQIAGWARKNPELTRTLGKVLIGTVAFATIFGPLLLTLSTLISSVTVLRGILMSVLLPFRMVGAANSAMTTHMTTATGAAKGMTGAMRALNGAVGTVGAAFAGWEVGKILDNLIGKALELRGGLLSTEMALSLGESKRVNQYVKDLGEFTGIDALKEIAEGNMARNAAERENVEEFSRRGLGRGVDSIVAGRMGGESLHAQKAEVNGVIKLEVDDKRVRVKEIKKGKGGPDLAVGTSSLGL